MFLFKIIAVFSTKGGTSNSTLACGLAHALKHRGFKAGPMDMDFSASDVDVEIAGLFGVSAI